MADQCSICLEALDGGVAALACGHRFHAACLARLARATGTSSTRRGALTACPNCRTSSRVAPMTPAAFSVGDRVLALWGHKWFPGDVYAVKDGGSAYEIAWDDEDSSNEVPASRVRAAPLTVDVDAPTARDTSPPAVVTPRVAPPAPSPVAPPAPTPRAIVPQARPRVRLAPAPAPSASRPHVASTSLAWVTVCTDLLEAAKDCTNMRGLREPLVSRGFQCGLVHQNGAAFGVTVPPDFPCYYDVIGKDYCPQYQNKAFSLSQLRKYLEGALALARAGDAFRTDAEYQAVRASAVRAKTSRFTGVRREKDHWRARIGVRGSYIELGAFDDEEDAARAYDAALVKYKNAPTVNFPGEAPLASVLAALPAALPAAPAAPAPLPLATRSHVASTSSAFVAVCTDLLDVTKDCTNLRGLREPLTSRGFRCGPDNHGCAGAFAVYVSPDFPCYYDIVGKDYNSKYQDTAFSLSQLRKYLEGALALARAGGAYRTQKDAASAAGEFDRCDTCNLAPPLATFSRSARGKRRRTCELCRAENEAAATRLDEAWKAAGVPADLPALREAYAREQAAKKQRV